MEKAFMVIMVAGGLYNLFMGLAITVKTPKESFVFTFLPVIFGISNLLFAMSLIGMITIN
jgi:hypothetical protein